MLERMLPVTGELAIVWSARLAVACYALRLTAVAARRREARLQVADRWVWTAGCLLLWLHVGAAFQFEHHWSHAAAYAHTAHRTLAIVGWNWGGGVYFNYALALLWAADVAAWWSGGPRHLQRRTWQWLLQAYVALMVLSATVVFGPGYWKVVAACFAGGLIALWCRRPLAIREANQ